MLCLFAWQSRLGLHKSSGVTRRGYSPVANMPQRLPPGEFARLERPRGKSHTPGELQHLRDLRMQRQPPFGSSAPAGPVPAIDDGAPQTISFGAVRNAKAADADATAKAHPQVTAAYNEAFRKIAAQAAAAASVTLNQPKDPPETPFCFGSMDGRNYKNRPSPLLGMPPPVPREPRDKWAAIDGLFSQDARAPTNGEEIAGELVLRREAEDGSTVTLRELREIKADAKMGPALMKLLKVSHRAWAHRGFTLDDPIPVSTLAREVGPETMPAAHLANIMLRVRDMREKVCLKDLRTFADAIYPANRAPIPPAHRLTFNELAKNAREFSTFAALHRLAKKVGDKHPDVGLDTRVDFSVLVAETGQETMALRTLVNLVLDFCIPKGMRAAGPVVGLWELLALAKERFLSDPGQSEELKAHLREIDETVRMSAADPARKAA